jgi:hypothetical protein
LARHSRAALAALALFAIATPAAAQQADSAEIRKLREQIEAITRTLEELQLGKDVVVGADTSTGGFGPAASKVYRVRQGVSIGGYGEALYQNYGAERQDGAPSGRRDELDYLRAIVYFGYKFNDKLLFNSEIEFEHASTGEDGEVSVEFAYLDYRLSPALGFRGGLLLAPMGFVNELHEPPVFLGTTRPETERQVIPSTWRENGLGVFGALGDFTYRAYLMAGFDATGFTAAGIRGGRQSGSRSLAEDFGIVGRVDWTGVPGLLLGASAYSGNSGQGATLPSDPAVVVAARTTILEGHAEYRRGGLELRGLVARSSLDDVARVNELNGLTGAQSVGEEALGWYVQGGFDMLRLARTSHQLIPYLRYERLDTQREVPAGFARDPANDRSIVSLGAMWKPIPQVALKADYQWQANEADTGVNQLNVNLGYLF